MLWKFKSKQLQLYAYTNHSETMMKHTLLFIYFWTLLFAYSIEFYKANLFIKKDISTLKCDRMYLLMQMQWCVAFLYFILFNF